MRTDQAATVPVPAMPVRKPTRDEIIEAVGTNAFKRGRDYFQHGHVLELEVSDGSDETVITAVTRGSQGEHYRQDIGIEITPFGALFDGDCSCPVGYNCKHVAAASLAYLDMSDDVANRPAAPGRETALFTRWLEALAVAGTVTQARSSGERLVWVLTTTAAFDSMPALQIEAREVKPHRQGGYSKGRRIDIPRLALSHNAERSASPADREIAALLLAGGEYWRGPSLNGNSGYHAMKALVANGQCYWTTTDTPALMAGPKRSLELVWKTHPQDGALQLVCSITGGGFIVPTTPPLYLDPASYLVGDLDALGLTAVQLPLVMNAPLIRAEQAGELAQLMVTRFPTLTVPPPMPVNVRELVGHTPVPTLELRGGPEGDEPWMTLDFAYADERIHALPSTAVAVLSAAAGLTRVVRDLAAERHAHTELHALGFVQSPSSSFGQPATRAVYAANTNEPQVFASTWSHFLRESVSALIAAGWQVTTAPDFDLRFESADWSADIDDEASGSDWFALGFKLEVAGQSLPLLEVLGPVLDADWTRLPPTVSIAIGPRRFIEVPASRLRPLLETLRTLFAGNGRLTDDGSRLRVPRTDARVLQDLEDQGLALQGGARWRELARRLSGFTGIREVTPEPGLRAELRDYQRRGLDWLQFLTEYGFNGILADDMGLGKTVQTLAHLLTEKAAGRLVRPALIVAPTSLMGNWQREALRFAPDLSVRVLHGQTRHERYAEASSADILLTTYPLLPRDAVQLGKLALHSLILDEAQTIKNPRAKAAQVVRRLNAEHRLCLTGTPLENHLGELWALFDFLMPGFLGDSETFRRIYRTPIENHRDTAREAHLARRLAPFMLRRTKQEVAAELPPKTEIVQPVEFGQAQAELYESIRVSVDRRVREAIERQGLARSQITILDALLKLRQVCCDPRLLPQDGKRTPPASAKLALLLELLDELLAENRRVLVFSQFTSMLALIEAELDSRSVAYTKLTGQTRRRDEAIDRFRNGEVKLFLISLKAGGVGLNLPEADTVIHYDPWWNPAAETQATDRAHRIGQTQPVFVYKLIVGNSVEEKMLELQARKRALAAGVYAGGSTDSSPPLNAETLAALLAPIEQPD